MQSLNYNKLQSQANSSSSDFSDWTLNPKFISEAIEIHPIEVYEHMLLDSKAQEEILIKKSTAPDYNNNRNKDISVIFDVGKNLKLDKITIHLAIAIYDIVVFKLSFTNYEESDK